jgi:hypothetical protein
MSKPLCIDAPQDAEKILPAEEDRYLVCLVCLVVG